MSLSEKNSDPFHFTIQINASQERVWKLLTEPELMLQWMGDPELELEVITSWEVGQPFTTRGFHHVKFENKGIVLAFEAPRLLRYSHLSSISRLADKAENYSVIEFSLEAAEDQTTLTITLSGFPTDSIYKHLEFYWRNTIGVIGQAAERL